MDRRKFIETLGKAGMLALFPGYTLADPVGAAQHAVFLTPADGDYALHTDLFNKRIHREPKVIAVCFDEAGVQEAIDMAKQRGLPVAVRSGGHSFEGFSLNDGGLSIDLMFMNDHKLLSDGQYHVEPACRLMQMYEYLIPQGRLVPTGSCGMVGMAGITLGGGYGIFSRQQGLACDWLRRIRLVDGNGDVHEVERGSDLFWACCGGGNGHFGVVTQLQFETTKAPPRISRHVFKSSKLSAQAVASLARLWFSLTAELPGEAFSAFVQSGRNLTILVTDTAPEMTPALASVLKQLEKAMEQRQPDRSEELLPGIRRYYGKLTPLNFKNASAGYYRGYGDIEHVAEQVFEKVIDTPELLFQINTLGGAIKKPPISGDLGCYAHRDYSYLGEIQSYWEDPAKEVRAVTGVAEVQRLLASAGVSAHYVNYPDIGFANWQMAYYGETNYRRLQAIKKRHDPENRFQYAQSVRLP